MDGNHSYTGDSFAFPVVLFFPAKGELLCSYKADDCVSILC